MWSAEIRWGMRVGWEMAVGSTAQWEQASLGSKSTALEVGLERAGVRGWGIDNGAGRKAG